MATAQSPSVPAALGSSPRIARSPVPPQRPSLAASVAIDGSDASEDTNRGGRSDGAGCGGKMSPRRSNARSSTAASPPSPANGDLKPLLPALDQPTRYEGNGPLLRAPLTSSVEQGSIPLETTNAWTLDVAIDVLTAISHDSDYSNASFHARGDVLVRHCQEEAAELPIAIQQQLAGVEALHSTIDLLHTELTRQQQLQRASDRNLDAVSASVDSCVSGDATKYKLDALSPANAVSSVRESTASRITGKKPPAVLARSPLAARVSPKPVAYTVAAMPSRTHDHEKNCVIHPHNGTDSSQELEPSQRELQAAVSLISSREEKIRAVAQQKTHWQREYELMREQVVAEKMRQVALFRRLEQERRDRDARCDDLERALRDAQLENQVLKAQVSEVRVQLQHHRHTAADLANQARDEKERLVCCIAETRHKFKEWKDGEAATLKAARDQAVHTLKTEYELKIARHHLEKQKLRDKVKDLEVSLRLLQKDRNLSPQELSMRKASILGSKDEGVTTAAELIDAQCRVRELEALLGHAKEYQSRQEHVMAAFEVTIARLLHERDVISLESSMTLRPWTSLLPLVGADNGACAFPVVDAFGTSSSALTDVINTSDAAPIVSLTDDANASRVATSTTQSTALPVPTDVPGVAHPIPLETPSKLRSQSLSMPPISPPYATRDGHVSRQRRATRVASDLNSAAMPIQRHHPMISVGSGGSSHSNTNGNDSGNAAGGNTVSDATDIEKEALLRQSILLSAEVEKYRHMVVQSQDEIRSLKENRRRSLALMNTTDLVGGETAGAGGVAHGLASIREQYLLNELTKVQHELDTVKGKRMKPPRTGAEARRKDPARSPNSLPIGPTLNEESENEDSDSDSEATSIGSDSESFDPSDSAMVDERQGSGQQLPRLAQDPSGVGVTGNLRSCASREDAAIMVIQRRSKGYLRRKDFVRKKSAVDKIKTRYRGYLVRKNNERSDHRSSSSSVLVLTPLMRIQMQSVAAHFVWEVECEDHPVRLSMRVSREPPVVQVDLSHPHKVGEPRSYYFHLFELVALMPWKKEAELLEKATEDVLARTFVAALQVTCVRGEYSFRVSRSCSGRTRDASMIPAITGSYLTPLRLQEHEPSRGGQLEMSGIDTSSATSTAIIVPDTRHWDISKASDPPPQPSSNVRLSDPIALEGDGLDTLIQRSRCVGAPRPDSVSEPASHPSASHRK